METFLGDLFSEGLVKAIYLTLFHSLWQGALIAVIAGIIILTTRKASSAWRYNLLLSSMMLFVCCTAFTFIKQSENITQSPLAVHIYSTDHVSLNSVRNTTAQSNIINITDSIVLFFNTNATAIVIFWFTVICFKCIQLLIGMSVTVTLRNRRIVPAGEYWENKLQELSTQLGINKYIKLSQSGLTKVPLTLGFFKPVILMPFGLLAAIPQDQIEAILLHELAHIKRRDYLINILQTMVEILFFFNPAIWWLSSLLRTERENCCDDFAVSKTSNKSDYIKALVAFEEYQGAMPQYASALTGPKNHLLKRVKRLIYNHNKTLNPMEKTILTCGLVVAGMLTVAFTQVEKHIIQKNIAVSTKKAEDIHVKSEKTVFLQDTTKKVTSSISTSTTTNVNGKKYRIRSKNDIVTELYVDDIRIPDDKISDYKSITDKIINDTRKSRLAAEKIKAAAQETKKMAETKKKNAQAKVAIQDETSKEAKTALKSAKEWEEQTKVYAKASKIESDEIRVKTEEIDRKIEELRELSDELRREERMEREDRKDREEKIEKEIKIETGDREIEGRLNREAMERRGDKLDRATSPVREKRADRPLEYSPDVPRPVRAITLKNSGLNINGNTRIAPIKPAEPFKYKADSLNYRPIRRLTPQRPTFGETIITELLDQGIIKDKNVTVRMTNDELIVNGEKQSEEAHQKVLSKIGNKTSGKFDFNYSAK